MISVDAFLFDLDGTLVDTRRDIANSVRHVQRILSLPETADETVVPYIGDGVARLLERALNHPLPPVLRQATELFRGHYQQHCLDFSSLYPDVRETLEFFKLKRLALVTNKPERETRMILKGLRIDRFFSVVVGGDTTAYKKPRPEPVRTALQALGNPAAASAVVVGDSSNDILAGKSAQARTCGLISNIGNPDLLRASEPDHIILNLQELTCYYS